MTTRSLRLPDPLTADADAYADSLGISFNALVAVALRDYLDARRAPKRSEAPATPSQASKSPLAQAAARPPQAPRSAPQHAPPARVGAGGVKVGRNDPCPCGSGVKAKRCCSAPGGLGA